MKQVVTLLFGCLALTAVRSQSAYLPLDMPTYHFLDRLEVKRDELLPYYHSSVKPYSRKALTDFANTFDTISSRITGYDRLNIYYIYKDNPEWAIRESIQTEKPLFNTFYKNKADFYHYSDENFDFRINPLIYFQYGRETEDPEEHLFINTRGVALRGRIDDRIGFYSMVTENQARHPRYIRDWIDDHEAVPGRGFYKSYRDNGVDYFNARGYVDFRLTEHVNMQFGHDQHFIGNGHRSLLLSNFSNNFFFLKANTRIWKINYTNLFAELTADYNRGGDRLLPKKYMALHHFSMNMTKWLNIGIFERVMFNRSNTLELQYFNPVIFYRSIEHDLGSPDNVMVGADFKANLLRRFSLYGQVVIDEFNLQQLRDSTGWWGNKHGMQLGLKYFDVAGINNLDLQLEFNGVRPYTYTHIDRANYTHYNQPLAHPLGANFHELLAIARYQPLRRLFFTARYFYVMQGRDLPGMNWGGDIFKSYVTREQDYQNYTGQGITHYMHMADFTATYHWQHDIYFDLRYIYRDLNSVLSIQDRQTHFLSLAVRMNLPQMPYDFY